MANSRSPHHFGRDPFQPQPLTPGPLGHNDAASPDTSSSFVGDTPGPLGRNDSGDPYLKSEVHSETTKARRPVPTSGALRSLVTSDRGMRFIWNEEYVAGISERLHWPRGASGVTLGAGYDMKTRSKQQVFKDLLNVGLSTPDSEIAAEGAGLKGDAANDFVYKNRGRFQLTEEQAIKLLRLILPSYEAVLKRLVQVPLKQYEFDALVSFAYNPGGRLRSVTRFINCGLTEAAMACIRAANTSGGKVVKALTARRRREINLYCNGRYFER